MQRRADKALKVDSVFLQVLADEQPRLADDDVQSQHVHLHGGGDEPGGHPLGLDLRHGNHGLVLVVQHPVKLDAGHFEDAGAVVAVDMVVQIHLLVLAGDEVHARVVDDALLRHRALLDG